MKESLAKKVSPIGVTPTIEGVKAGSISRIDEGGVVWVDFPGNLAGPIKARLTGAMANQLRSNGSVDPIPVLLAFEGNDPGKPIVVDILRENCSVPNPSASVTRDDIDSGRIDGERVTFDAQKEIVLRCGKASITLTRSGKVLIRGAYLLNRSSGVNRIKGGSVQIN